MLFHQIGNSWLLCLNKNTAHGTLICFDGGRHMCSTLVKTLFWPAINIYTVCMKIFGMYYMQWIQCHNSTQTNITELWFIMGVVNIRTYPTFHPVSIYFIHVQFISHNVTCHCTSCLNILPCKGFRSMAGAMSNRCEQIPVYKYSCSLQENLTLHWKVNSMVSLEWTDNKLNEEWGFCWVNRLDWSRFSSVSAIIITTNQTMMSVNFVASLHHYLWSKQ